MSDKSDGCSHPRMCPEDSFQERIKREKLSLESPPPAELVRRPQDRAHRPGS